MIIIQREYTNPYFNIAAEEFLIKTLNEPCFMLWQNSPSIIIGKHQNTINEVNLQYVKDHNIPVIRRISGGGTVFHDLGNLNYSFIDIGRAGSLVNFEKYSKPILNLLQKLGVNAQLVGKSDLKIDGKKFSGNASHVYKNKVLHHGTLLFNSNLCVLQKSITINKNNISDKAVKSNRSTVTNISEYLDKNININKFKNLLSKHILKEFPNAKIHKLTDYQIDRIETLAEEKYRSWEWNYGYGPKYQMESSYIINDKKMLFNIFIKRGFIHAIEGDKPLSNEIQHALNLVIGKQHQIEIINEALRGNTTKNYIKTITEILF